MSRKGISVPLTTILMTLVLIAIASAMAVRGMVLTSFISLSSPSSGAELHFLIEAVYASNPGTSITAIVRSRTPIIASAEANGTSVVYTASNLPDPAGIVVRSEPLGGGLIKVTYSPSAVKPFRIPAGINAVVISKGEDGAVRIALEGAP